MWSEHEQAACISVAEERMRHQKLLRDSEVTTVVGSLWSYIVGTSVAGSGTECLTFHSFLLGLV